MAILNKSVTLNPVGMQLISLSVQKIAQASFIIILQTRNIMEFLEICIQALVHSLDTNCTLWRESRRHAKLWDHPKRVAKVNFK